MDGLKDCENARCEPVREGGREQPHSMTGRGQADPLPPESVLECGVLGCLELATLERTESG